MTTKHEQLYKTYAKELRQAKTAAEKWWKQLIASETVAAGSKKEAMARLEKRWPFGPSAHPWVVAVLRKNWLACEAINEWVREQDDPDSDEEIVSPIVFLCEYLLDGKNEKLAVFISSINYWPLGTPSIEQGLQRTEVAA